MLSVLFFSVAKRKVDLGPRNANEKISETLNRVVSKTVKVSLIYRFLHRFQVKKHMIVLLSKLLSLKLRVSYLLRNLPSKQDRSRTGNSNSTDDN